MVSNLGHVKYTCEGKNRHRCTTANCGSKAGDAKRIKQMEVCVPRPNYKRKYSAINVGRIVWESFHQGIPWQDGWEIDHIDRNVQNNAVWNVRAVTHSENMLNRGAIRRKSENEVCPGANDYAYRMRLKYGVTTIKKLPDHIRKEYNRMRYQEKAASKRKQTIAA